MKTEKPRCLHSLRVWQDIRVVRPIRKPWKQYETMAFDLPCREGVGPHEFHRTITGREWS